MREVSYLNFQISILISNAHTHPLDFFPPYHHFTWLEIFYFMHRSLRTVVKQLKTTFCHNQASERPALLHRLLPKQEKVRQSPCSHHLHGHFWSILELWACYLLHRHRRKRWSYLRELAGKGEDREEQAGTD